MICPLMSTGAKKVDCAGKECAIWHESDRCGMLHTPFVLEEIADAIENMEEVLASIEGNTDEIVGGINILVDEGEGDDDEID